MNRRDQELWNTTLAENVSWTLPGRTVEGKEAVIELWTTFMGSVAFAIQLVHQGTVHVNGDRSSGRWYLTEHVRPTGERPGTTTIGCYSDAYVKQDGRWLFEKRAWEILHTAPLSPS